MFWYLFEELADFYKVDHEYHEAGSFFTIWAKNDKEAIKIAERWSSESDSLSIGGRYKTVKAAAKAVKSKGKKYKSSVISFCVRDGALMSANDLIKLNESFKVNSPTLNKLVNMEYSDPRLKEGCKIVAEKCGSFRHGDDVVEGSYIMYQDNALPGKFVAVHVSDTVNEETEEPNVAVVAIGNNRQKVMQNMAYRMRRNQTNVVEEGKTPTFFITATKGGSTQGSSGLYKDDMVKHAKELKADGWKVELIQKTNRGNQPIKF